jgi:hypothetical protein
MRDYFKQEYGLNCFALYRSLSELPTLNFVPAVKELRVGHIGSLYLSEPFRRFVKSCQKFAASENRVLKIVRIGVSPEMETVAAEDPELFENYGELTEPDALPLLANCNFLYAMYPDGFRFKGFRRISLPMDSAVHNLRRQSTRNSLCSS